MKQIKIYNYCLRCGRKLKSEENKLRGFGKVCWEKSKRDNRFKPLFNTDMQVKD